ncbi:MAG TPA: class I SAM-dependent methyltransferase [Acidimicrobiia bacterium]|nr:class I SAM-dependent methyltransferase [Acidimicrobiia bacterium]
MSARRRPDYGVDAPGVVRALAIAAGAGLVLAIVGITVDLRWLFWVGLGILVYFGVLTSLHLRYSKVSKLRERVRVLDAARLDGHETVLDVGCGRGLLLVEAARRLPDGRAVGVDIWSLVDQSKNEPAAPLQNARVENVGPVAVSTADARDLPFADQSFDAVVSQFALHNIRSVEGRRRAIREIDRVLKPGGRLVMLDLARTLEYAAQLGDAGWDDVLRSRRTWRLFPPARYVSGTKA